MYPLPELMTLPLVKNPVWNDNTEKIYKVFSNLTTYICR